MSVLITGASSGLGRELAVLFGRTDSVVLAGRSQDALQKTLQRIYPGDFDCRLSVGDLFEGFYLADLMDLARQSETLVLAADSYRPFPGQALTIVEANINLIEAFLRGHSGFCASRQIVYLNSVAGIDTASWAERMYSAEKHAMTSYIRTLTREVRGDGRIRVLNVILNACNTPMTAARPDHDYLIDSAEAAKCIYDVVSNPMLSAQVSEIHISRFRFPPEGSNADLPSL